MPSSFDFEDELQLFRDSARRFIRAEIESHAEEWERKGLVPRSVWNQLGEAGLLCADIPTAYGGAGATPAFSAVVLEELIYAGCNGLAGSVAVHSDIVAHYLHGHATEEQKQKYLPKMVKGTCVGAVAMTEPGAGSDLQAIRTSAVRENDDYVINGAKTFVTNGYHCDFVITVARSNAQGTGSAGTSLFIIDTDTPGFVRGKKLDKIGFRMSDTLELFYDDVRVRESQLLGELDKGFYVLMNELPRERWILGVTAVAASEVAMQWTEEYVRERHAFGGPIANFQNTRFRIAEMKTETTVHRAFINDCTRKLERGDLDTATASMAKLACSEMQGRVVDGCLQMFGGYGYMRESPIARAYTDARAQRIYGGTSEIMKEIISRSVLGR